METTVLKKMEGKCLTFRLGREEYGVEILKVREIVGLMDITAVPKTSAHVRGVVNLRGKIIPVVDLRRKLGLPDVEASRENCIIIVIVQANQTEVLVGLLVDAVNEVLWISEGEVDPLPDIGDEEAINFVRGLAKVRGRVVILLDIDKVVRQQELKGLDQLEKMIEIDGTKEGSND
jgi:purine-binding chemotaxis protein CheW